MERSVGYGVSAGREPTNMQRFVSRLIGIQIGSAAHMLKPPGPPCSRSEMAHHRAL